MAGYTKLFASLLASTIWRESDKVRIVWITLLAMADQRGIAEGSIPGIADLARVSLKDCEKALTRLQEPDQYSRSQEHDGRRVCVVAGGFLVLNHAKYRERMNAEERREYQRRWIADRRRQMSTVSTQAEADSEAEASKKIPPTPHANARGKARRPNRKEREQAAHILRNRFGECQHEPRCENNAACERAIALGLMEKAS